jgi:hypothetical protein
MQESDAMAMLHTLPSPSFDSIRDAIRGTPIVPSFNVLIQTETDVPIIKTESIVFKNESKLIFKNIPLPL